MELNEYQIEIIDQLLQQKQLTRAELRSELLDHISCHVESLMAQGLTFEQALLQSLALFDEDEMKNLNQINYFIHFSKRKIMSYSISAAVVIFGLFIGTNQMDTNSKIINQSPVVDCIEVDPPSKVPLLEEPKHISSGFGRRIHPVKKVKQFHKGVDFAAKKGTLVIAPSNGIIIKAGFDNNYGWNIIIKHDEHYQTRYAHLSELLVKKGDIVILNQTIGKVGNTGKSTAPHLHYEVIKDGKKVDPVDYFGP